MIDPTSSIPLHQDHYYHRHNYSNCFDSIPVVAVVVPTAAAVAAEEEGLHMELAVHTWEVEDIPSAAAGVAADIDTD